MAGRFRIVVVPAARRDLKALAPEILPRLDARILDLAADPHPPGAQRLAGDGEVYRVRVGDYRILYTVSTLLQVVTILAVGHRRDVYR